MTDPIKWLSSLSDCSESARQEFVRTRLQSALRTAKLPALVKLLDAIRTQTSEGIKPFVDLFIATCSRPGTAPLVKALIDAEACPNTIGIKGLAAMHVCANENLRILLDSGGDVNVKSADQATPLQYRCERGNLDESNFDGIAMLLHAGANPNTRNICWEAPMHGVLKRITELVKLKGLSVEETLDAQAARMVRLLVDYGADPRVRAPDGSNLIGWLQGQNAMHFYNYNQTTRTILELGGAVDHGCGQLYRSANLALEQDDVLLLRAVIDAGASPTMECGDLLHDAVAHGAVGCVTTLLEAGWDPMLPNSECIPLMEVESVGYSDHHVQQCKDVVRSFIGAQQARKAILEIAEEQDGLTRRSTASPSA